MKIYIIIYKYKQNNIYNNEMIQGSVFVMDKNEPKEQVSICYFINVMIDRNNNIILVLMLAVLVIKSLFTAGV